MPDHTLPPDAVDVSLEHLLSVLLDGNKLVPLMDDVEAHECMRAILTDPDDRQRAFASGALAVGAAVTLRFPGDRAQVFMSELMRALRDVTPWGDAEDHR